MATFILSRSLPGLLLAFIALLSKISISEAESSFFSYTRKNASFKPDDIALYGDAKIVDGGSSISIQLNDSASHVGVGRVVYKKPIEFAETKSEYPAVFSTVLAFSISPNRGGRLGFVVFPVNGTFDQSFLEVKFDTSETFGKFGDSNVTVIVDGTTFSEDIRNYTVANLEEEKLLLYALINYIASGKFLEVRLSKSESFKTVDTLMFTRIDLSRMLKDEDEFMVGLKSYSGSFTLHYWSSETRCIPKSAHSNLLIDLPKIIEEEEAKKRRRRDEMWGIVSCFVMTVGSVGIVFFALMHIWAALKRNNLAMVMQEECGIKTKEFEYEKMEKMESDNKQARK